MVNLAYRAARTEGAIRRSLYSSLISPIVRFPLKQSRRLPISVFSFSGEQYLPEQVACIRSFIRNVGIPDSFTVVSDGSYSPKSSELLRQTSECISLVDWMDFASNLPPAVQAFGEHNAMGKKLAVLLSMPLARPAVYTDCDILFFPGARELIHLVESNANDFWYLPDCLTSLDKTILLNDAESRNPVNAGFMLLKKRLDWGPSLDRLAAYPGIPCSQTEQTIVHLAMHQSGAAALNPDRFVLSLMDQFVYKDHYAGQRIALRHYVNNVRHKFWQSIGLRAFNN
jgi:hypothetical protein